MNVVVKIQQKIGLCFGITYPKEWGNFVFESGVKPDCGIGGRSRLNCPGRIWVRRKEKPLKRFNSQRVLCVHSRREIPFVFIFGYTLVAYNSLFKFQHQVSVVVWRPFRANERHVSFPELNHSIILSALFLKSHGFFYDFHFFFGGQHF